MVNVGKSAIHGPYRVLENQNKAADGHLLHLAMMKGHDGKDLTSSAEGGSVRDQFSPGSEIGDRSGTKESESSFFVKEKSGEETTRNP